MDSSKSLQKAEVSWSEAVIMICTKCAKKIAVHESDVDLSDTLKHALKTQLKTHLKSDGLQPKIRTLTTSCLDICPDDRVAIAFAIGAQKGAQKNAFEAVTMHKNADVNRTAAEIIEKIKSRL